jgi:hypothetical protein
MADKVVQKGRQKHDGNSAEKKGKAQQAHQKNVHVLGEAGGRPQATGFCRIKIVVGEEEVLDYND